MRSDMSVSDTVPMVRCRLDGPEDEPVGALRYVPLAEFGLWQHLMETRHRRQVTVEEVSVWVPEDAARWNSGSTARRAASPCCACGSSSPARTALPVPVERFFPAETYPEAQEALLPHYDGTPAAARCAPRPGYFVPAAARAARPDRSGLTPSAASRGGRA